MIHVDRSTVPAPLVLGGPKGRGVKEAERAKKALAKWTANGKSPAKWTFKFTIYSHDEVKQSLADLFNGKCAYCESRYATTQPMDVEHWRPKAQISGDNGGPEIKPAYYWLAAAWENLLPCCIDCNRARWQEDTATGTRRKLGKQDQFPIEPGTARASNPGEELNESPLLINPATELPEDYLRFTDDAIVEPAPPGRVEQRRARASIDVYALNRSELVLARKEHLRVLLLHLGRIECITRVLARLRDGDAEVQVLLEELLLLDLRGLARMRSATEPYAQQARQLIDRHMDGFLRGQGAGLPTSATAPGRVV